MSIEYPVQLRLHLTPVGNPWVRISLDEHIQEKQLERTTTFDWDFDAVDSVCLSIEHFNKRDDDPTTSITIDSIEFYGIGDIKFVQAGHYIPAYPEPWYSELETKPAKILTGQTCLGWNGVYKLEFTVPVFTWMHNVLDLGWIYK